MRRYLLVLMLIGTLLLAGFASATITEYAYGTASLNVSDGGTAANIFDGNPATYGATRIGGAVSMDYGAGVTRTINMIDLKVSSGYPDRMPREFVFEGSNDGSTYTQVFKIDNTTHPALRYYNLQNQTFNFTNSTTPYRYYRLTTWYADYQGRTPVAGYVLFGDIHYKYNDDANRNDPNFYPTTNTSIGWTDWAAYNTSSFTAFNNTPIAFKDSTVNSTGAITDWYWDFGDSTTSIDQNPTHTYTANGTYNVVLTTKVNSVNVTITKKINIVKVVEYPQFWFGVATVQTASGTAGGSAAFAHNGNTLDYWQNTPLSWYKMDYVTPRVMNGFFIQYGASWSDFAPREYFIDASNDGTSWTLLDVKYLNQTQNVTRRVSLNSKTFYNFTNTNAYRYYRINGTGTYQYQWGADINGLLLPEADWVYEDPAILLFDYSMDDAYATVNEIRNLESSYTILVNRPSTFRAEQKSGGAITSYSWSNNGVVVSTNSTYTNTSITGNTSFFLNLTMSDGLTTDTISKKIYAVNALEYGYSLASTMATSSTVTAGAARYAFDGSNDAASGSIVYIGNVANYPNAYLRTDYGAGHSVIINEVELRESQSYLDGAPRQFRIESSNDGTTWTTLDNRTMLQNRMIEKTYAGTSDSGAYYYHMGFVNTNPYRYYRINVTATDPSQSVATRTAISEIRFRYHDPNVYLNVDGYVAGDGYLGIDTYQQRQLFTNQTFTVMAGKSVTFYDASIGSPSSWVWDKTNDGAPDAFTQNYTTTYATPGVYTMSFTVSNGIVTKTKYFVINVDTVYEAPYYYNDPLGSTIGGSATATGTTNGNPNYPFEGLFLDGSASGWNYNVVYPEVYIQVRYGKNTSVVNNEIFIHSSAYDANWLLNTPRQFMISGSNDGSAWITLDNRTINSNRVTRKISAVGDRNLTYTFENTNAYRYYRLSINMTTPQNNIKEQTISTLQFRYHDPAGWIDPSFYVANDGIVGVQPSNYDINSDRAVYNDTFTVMTNRSVQFRDDSLGTPTSWLWDFGDGTAPSILQHPTHTYTTDGFYKVTMTATGGGVSATKNASIFSNASYVYSYAWGINSSATVPWGVSSLRADAGVVTRIFDDQKRTGAQFEQYQVDTTGNGIPPYIIIDFGNKNISTKRVVNEVAIYPVTATHIGYTPMALRIESSNDSVTWFMLENRSESSFTRLYPHYPYSTPMIISFNNPTPFRYYKVTSLTTGQNWEVSSLDFRYHEPSTWVDCDFYINRSWISDTDEKFLSVIPNRSVFRNELVTFNDTSFGATTYTWDLNGDGATDSTSQNTTYTYPTVGVYMVTHTAINGTISATKYTTVKVVDVLEPMYGNNYALNSATTPGAWAITADRYDAQNPYNAADQSIATYWYASTAAPHWIRYDYGGGKTNISNITGYQYPIINRYVLKSGTSAAEMARMPRTWVLNGSNTGAMGSWVTLDSQTLVPFWATSETRTYDFVNGNPYRYLNFTVTATNTTAVEVWELNFMYTGNGSSPPPVASFTMSATNGSQTAQKVVFTDTSTNANTWLWDFGDNSTSTTENPSHWYSVANNYTINLTATNAWGSSYATQQYYNLTSDWDDQHISWVQFNAAPGSTTIADKNGAITWVANGVANISGTANVGFGNGSLVLDGTGNVSTTSAVFDLGVSDGTFEIWFKRGNSDGGVQTLLSKGNYSSGYELFLSGNKLNFRADQISPASTLTIVDATTITDTTTWHHAVVQKNGTAWSLYRDGTLISTTTWADLPSSSSYKFRIGSAEGTSPYQFVGNVDEFRYSTVKRWAGASPFDVPYNEYLSINQTAIIMAPVASFTPTPLSPAALGTEILFTDTSTSSPTAWGWTFGDNNYTANTTQNPRHLYLSPAIYTVKLNVSNVYGFGESTQSFTVYDSGGITLQSIFTPNTTTGYAYPWAVLFSDVSIGSPTTWNWTFGDTYTSTSQNPTHNYTVAGAYTVKLNVSNSTGHFSDSTQTLTLVTDDDVYLKSWHHFNTSAGLSSGEKGVAWTNVGCSASAGTEMFGAASLYCPTGNNYFYSASSAVWNRQTTGEIEFWINVTSIGDAGKPVIGRYTEASPPTNGWGMYNIDGTESGWSFWWGNAAANHTAGVYIPSNNWTHVVYSWDGTYQRIFIDGALQTRTSQPSGSFDTVNQFRINTKGAGTEHSFYIDEFRFTQGIPRFVSMFDTPPAQYVGSTTGSIDFNPNSTYRYKTDPAYTAAIYNQTDGGSRNRTVQVQNITGATYLSGGVTFDPIRQIAKAVRLNTTDYADLVLESSSIDNVVGEATFNVSRGGTNKIVANLDTRKSLVDVQMLYWNYTPDTLGDQYFTTGMVINETTSYPVHYFIHTPITFGVWDFFPNFSSSTTTPVVGEVVTFYDNTTGYPSAWNWSWGDGTWSNGTLTSSTTHSYGSTGSKTVTMVATLWQNYSIWNVTTRIAYINVSGAPSFTPADIWMEGQYIQTFRITDSATGLPIPVVQIQDNNGQTFATTNGTGYLTSSFGAASVIFTSTGYDGRAISYFFDSNATWDVQLTTTVVQAPNTNLNILYPREVIFRAINAYDGSPLVGVNVTATVTQNGISNTNWLTTLFGISTSATPVNSTVLTSYTDSDGSVVFPMVASLQYTLLFESTAYGISTTKTVNPANAAYVYMLFPTRTLKVNMADYINGTLYQYAPNTSWVNLSLNYTDASSTTNSVTFYVNAANGTRVYTETYSGINGLNTSKMIANVKSTSYVWGYYANTSRFGNVSQALGIIMKGSSGRLINLDPCGGYATGWGNSC